MPYRQSLWRTQITVGASGREYNLGVADRWSGAGAGSDGSSYARANGDVALGGRKSREEGTARYLYDERLHAMFKALDAGVGTFRAVVTRSPLADDGTPFIGGGFTMTGILTGVSQPDTDYSSNDGAEVELTFTLDAPLA